MSASLPLEGENDEREKDDVLRRRLEGHAHVALLAHPASSVPVTRAAVKLQFEKRGKTLSPTSATAHLVARPRRPRQPRRSAFGLETLTARRRCVAHPLCARSSAPRARQPGLKQEAQRPALVHPPPAAVFARRAHRCSCSRSAGSKTNASFGLPVLAISASSIVERRRVNRSLTEVSAFEAWTVGLRRWS